MCLETIFDEKRKNSEIEKLKTNWRGYVKTWKVLIKRKNIYITPITAMILYKGKNIFSQYKIFSYINNLYYKGGTHLFICKKDAEKWLYDSDCKVVECKIKKEWINSIGTQRIYVNSNTIIDAFVIVCSKAILPKYISNSISKYTYLFKKCLYKFCREEEACA